jgi:hypothetical protein
MGTCGQKSLATYARTLYNFLLGFSGHYAIYYALIFTTPFVHP